MLQFQNVFLHLLHKHLNIYTMRTSILIETSLRYATTASYALKDSNIEKVFDCEIYYKSGSEFVIYMNDDSVDDELCDTIRDILFYAGVTEYELF